MNHAPAKADVNVTVYDFIGKVPDELICKLCSKVLREPRQVVCCGGHYCQNCIEKRINQNYSCPSCKTQSFNHFRDVHFEQRVNNLRIHCSYHKKGCKWTGELSSIKSHLVGNPGCGYSLAPCPNKCGQSLQRKDVRDHLTKQCDFRKVRCQYCGHDDTFVVVTGEHYKVCVSFPIKCPYNCGIKGIRRSEMPKHEEGCSLRPIECPFMKAGCNARPLQKDLSEHLASNSPTHISMMSKSFDALQSKLQTAEKEAEEKTDELEELLKLEESNSRIVGKKLLAIASNAEELLKTCSDGQRLAIQSIRSLTDESFHLKDIEQPLSFRMINYSEFKRNSKPWYSAPFYVADGYKMCLAVHANGSGMGYGMFVSVSLCLMQGEFDDELNWPVELPFHLIIEGICSEDYTDGNPPANPKAYVYFHSDTPQERVTDTVLIEARKCDNFVTHEQTENQLLYYDAISFQVSAESEFL